MARTQRSSAEFPAPSRAEAVSPSAHRRASVILLTGAGAVQLTSNAAAAFVSTTVLGPGQRGVMVLGMSIGSVLSMVGTMGTNTALRSRLPGCTDPADRRVLVSSYTWWSAVAVVLAAGSAVGVSAFSASFVEPALSGNAFLAAVAAFTATQVLLLQTTEAWFADGRFRRGGNTAAAIATGGLLALLAASAVSGTAATLLFAQAFGCAAVWCLQVRRMRRQHLLSLARTSLGDIKALVAAGFPTLGLAVGLAIALRADRYVLGVTEGAVAVGVYSLAATVSEIVRIFPQSLGQLFMRDTALGIGRARLLRWMLLAMAVAAVGNAAVVVLARLLIVPVFGTDFATARDLLIVLAVAEVCYAPYAVASRGLLGGGWAKTAGVLGIGGSVWALLCYVLSANLAGTTGIAVSCVFVYTGLTLASWVLLRRRLSGRRKTATNTSTTDSGDQHE